MDGLVHEVDDHDNVVEMVDHNQPEGHRCVYHYHRMKTQDGEELAHFKLHHVVRPKEMKDDD